MPFLKTKWMLALCLFFFFSCGKSDSEAAIQLNKQGEQALEEQNYSVALTYFQKANSESMSDELSSRVYRNISSCFLFSNELDSALFYSQKAKELANENSYDFFLNQGEIYLLENKILLAKKSFEEANRLNENRMEASANLALIYRGDFDEKLTDYAKATHFIQQAISVKNTFSNQEILGIILIQQEKYSEAKPIFEKLTQTLPTSMLHRFHLGLIRFSLGEEEEGMKLMSEAADRDEMCRDLLEAMLE